MGYGQASDDEAARARLAQSERRARIANGQRLAAALNGSRMARRELGERMAAVTDENWAGDRRNGEPRG